MLSNPHFQVASRLLIGLMCRARSRDRGDQIADVRHALEVSAELIRQWRGNHLPTRDYAPPTSPQQGAHKCAAGLFERIAAKQCCVEGAARQGENYPQNPGSLFFRECHPCAGRPLERGLAETRGCRPSINDACSVTACALFINLLVRFPPFYI